MESSLYIIEKSEADTIRAKVSLTLQNSEKPKNNLSKGKQSPMKDLMKNENIIILPAGKGQATVILNKVDYLLKCNQHNRQRSVYKYLKRDPTEFKKGDA